MPEAVLHGDGLVQRLGEVKVANEHLQLVVDGFEICRRSSPQARAAPSASEVGTAPAVPLLMAVLVLAVVSRLVC